MEYENINDWRTEFRTLQACRKALEASELHAAYEARTPAFENYVNDVIDKFGGQRVNIVLGYTIRDASWDGRYSRDVKAWAEQQPRFANSPRVGVSAQPREYTELFSSAHPVILNFVAKVKMEHDMQQKSPMTISKGNKSKDRGDAR